MRWEDGLKPVVRRLTVSGKFTNGCTFDGPGANALAKIIEMMAEDLDRREMLDTLKWHRNLVLKEAAWCVAVLALFVVGGVFFNG